MKNDRESEDLAFDFCKKALLERIEKRRDITNKTMVDAFGITNEEYAVITDSLKHILVDLRKSPTYSDTYYLLLENSNSLTDLCIKSILYYELDKKIREQQDPFSQLIKLLMK